MSFGIAGLLAGFFGVIVVVYMLIETIPQMAGLGLVGATDSANLISTSVNLSTALPIIGIITIVGLMGLALDASRR